MQSSGQVQNTKGVSLTAVCSIYSCKAMNSVVGLRVGPYYQNTTTTFLVDWVSMDNGLLAEGVYGTLTE